MADYRLGREMIVPLGIPGPETGSSKTRLAVLDSPVTNADPSGVVVPVKTVVIPVTVGENDREARRFLPAVAPWLSVICVLELIAAIVVPPGMPVPVTVSPTNRFAVLDSPVTTTEANVRVLDPLVGAPG